MAKFSNVNNLLAAPSAVGNPLGFYYLKEVLKAAGWTIPSSSDGSTYNASGDQISHGASGANGMGNNNAWYRAREPGGRREWCIQVGLSGGQNAGGLRVKYSALARFTGGSPSATRVPSATDEQTLPNAGSGTDASPVFAGGFTVGLGTTVRVHIVANSTAVGGVYPFVLFCTQPAAATSRNFIIAQEPMAPGSYSAGDGDPCAVLCNPGVGPSGFLSGTNWSAWFGFGTAGQTWVPALAVPNVGPFNGALGVDVGDSTDINGYPTYSGTVSAAVRIKGVGSTIAAKGPARPWPATTNTATDAKVYLDTAVLPYPDNTVPSVS